MRRWIPVALIGLAILWFILTNVGSSMALNDLAARPILALTRADGTRVPVQQPGANPSANDARPQQGAGVMFGFRVILALPDGGTVACTQRFTALSCDGGWLPERAS